MKQNETKQTGIADTLGGIIDQEQKRLEEARTLNKFQTKVFQIILTKLQKIKECKDLGHYINLNDLIGYIKEGCKFAFEDANNFSLLITDREELYTDLIMIQADGGMTNTSSIPLYSFREKSMDSSVIKKYKSAKSFMPLREFNSFDIGYIKDNIFGFVQTMRYPDNTLSIKIIIYLKKKIFDYSKNPLGIEIGGFNNETSN